MKQASIFWEWFVANEDRFRDLDVPEREALLDELLTALQTYSAGLWFESGIAGDGVNELIISAEGNLDCFSDVRLLVASAPSIPGWRVIAFKPANGFAFTTRYEGITFSPEATWFLPLASVRAPGAVDIRVGYAHYDEGAHQRFLTGTYIMLECALGELALAEKVGRIEVSQLPSSPPTSGYLPLPELARWMRTPPD
jgi:hypothetical protein